MSNHNPKFIKINSLSDAKSEIIKIGSDSKSIDIMAPKAISKIIKLENVHLQDAIIVKQDMLSIGGEVAVPKNVFELKEKSADILIIGTIKQLYDLVEKLNRHYPRIKKISNEISFLLKSLI
jgi:dihydropteroate synthase